MTGGSAKKVGLGRILHVNPRMITIRAHFDGKVLVPEEPLDLEKGQEVELHVREVGTAEHPNQAVTGFDMVDGFPLFRMPADAPVITDEDVKRGEEEW